MLTTAGSSRLARSAKDGKVTAGVCVGGMVPRSAVCCSGTDAGADWLAETWAMVPSLPDPEVEAPPAPVLPRLQPAKARNGRTARDWKVARMCFPGATLGRMRAARDTVSLAPQRGHRIDPGSSPGGQPTGDERGRRQHRRHRTEGGGVGGAHLVKCARKEPGEHPRPGDPEKEPRG